MNNKGENNTSLEALLNVDLIWGEDIGQRYKTEGHQHGLH